MPRRPAKSTAGTLRLRPGLIDIERATAEIRAVQGCNCAVRLSRIRHFDKGKAACATRVSVSYKVDPLHFSIRLEKCAEGRFGSTEIQISYKDVFHVVKRWSFKRAGETRRIWIRPGCCETPKAYFEFTTPKGRANKVSRSTQPQCVEDQQNHDPEHKRHQHGKAPIKQSIHVEADFGPEPPDLILARLI